MTVGVFVAVGVGVAVGVADSGVVGSASSGGGGSELSTSDTLPVTLVQRSLTASCTPPASDHTIQTMMVIAMPLSTQGTLFIIHRRHFLRLERREGEDEALRLETLCRRMLIMPVRALHGSTVPRRIRGWGFDLSRSYPWTTCLQALSPPLENLAPYSRLAAPSGFPPPQE